VTTAVATTSVTGSGLTTGFTGDVGFRTNCNQGGLRVTQGFVVRSLTPGQGTNNQMTPPMLLTQRNFAAMLGDTYGGTTPSERGSLTNLGGGRGIIGFAGGGAGNRNVIIPPITSDRTNLPSTSTSDTNLPNHNLSVD